VKATAITIDLNNNSKNKISDFNSNSKNSINDNVKAAVIIYIQNVVLVSMSF
jgi:hypothetical protein